MPDTPPLVRKRRKRRRRKNALGYLLLFVFVFFLALFGLSYLVKSFSPDVDVAIGNSESLTLNNADSDSEIKTIDERLKWIQMEDELPSVSIKPSKENIKPNDKSTIKEQTQEPKKEESKKEQQKSDKIKLSESKKEHLDFRLPKNITVAEPQGQKPKTSKVYIGKYNSIEDAIKIQHKISLEESDIIPFIKNINGQYVVQIGSFSDSNRATTLVNKMKTKGYPASVVIDRKSVV